MSFISKVTVLIVIIFSFKVFDIDVFAQRVSLENIRVGEKKNGTRIVLDFSHRVYFHISQDHIGNQENSYNNIKIIFYGKEKINHNLKIKLKQNKYGVGDFAFLNYSKSFASSDVFFQKTKSFYDWNNLILNISLQERLRVYSVYYLKPQGKTRLWRLVIDLMPYEENDKYISTFTDYELTKIIKKIQLAQASFTDKQNDDLSNEMSIVNEEVSAVPSSNNLEKVFLAAYQDRTYQDRTYQDREAKRNFVPNSFAPKNNNDNNGNATNAQNIYTGNLKNIILASLSDKNTIAKLISNKYVVDVKPKTVVINNNFNYFFKNGARSRARVNYKSNLSENVNEAKKKYVIVIDPGHGGKDPGAIGINKSKEKDITLRAAFDLKDLLERTKRYKVYLTRKSDEFIPLEDRGVMARKMGADLFISLHADAHDNPKLRGASVYTISKKASKKYDKEQSNKGNFRDYADELYVQSNIVSDILVDVARRETNTYSTIFANILARNISMKIKTLNHTVRNAGYVVLLSPTVPAILFEMAYISNYQDEENLNSYRWRKNVMIEVVKSINFYYDNLNKY